MQVWLAIFQHISAQLISDHNNEKMAKNAHISHSCCKNNINWTAENSLFSVH